MNFSMLVPLLTCISTAILIPLLNSIGIIHDAREYRVTLGLRMFVWLGTVGFAMLPFLLVPYSQLIHLPGEVAVNGMLVVFLLVGCVYMQRYCIRLGNDGITFHGFKTRMMKYQDIESAKVYVSGRGTSFLDIYFRDGSRRFRMSGNVGRFDELVDNLQIVLKARKSS
jgi:hypothetical protein